MKKHLFYFFGFLNLWGVCNGQYPWLQVTEIISNKLKLKGGIYWLTKGWWKSWPGAPDRIRILSLSLCIFCLASYSPSTDGFFSPSSPWMEIITILQHGLHTSSFPPPEMKSVLTQALDTKFQEAFMQSSCVSNHGVHRDGFSILVYVRL